MEICLLGDSLFARYEGAKQPMITQKLYDKLGDKHHIENVGVSGNNSFDALERLEKDVVSKHPDLVIIMLGANDAAIHKLVALEDFKYNMLQIVQRLKQTKVVLVSFPAVDEDKQLKRKNNLLDQYAKVLEEIAINNQLIYIDFFNKTLHHKNHKELMQGIMDDGLHMGILGYEVLSDVLIQEIGL